MTYRVDAMPGEQLSSGEVDTVAKVVRARLARSGRTGQVTADTTAHRLVIRVDGAPLRPKERSLLFAHALLGFYDLETAATGRSAVDQNGNVRATTSLFGLLAGQQAAVRRAGKASAWYLFDKREVAAGGPAPTRTILLSRHGGLVPKGFTVFGVPQDTIVITCGTDEIVCPAANGAIQPTQTSYYLFKHGSYPNGPYPSMTSADLDLSKTQADLDVSTGGPEVLLAFTRAGGKRFKQITRDEYRRGRVFHNAQHFAIVLDNEIRSFPQIDYTDSTLSKGIDPVNGARITGLKSLQEAKNIALALQSDLPFHLVLLSARKF